MMSAKAGVLSFLLFLLLWEWLRPLIALSHLTDLHLAQPMLLAIACFILIDYLRCPWWAGFPLKMVVCLTIIAYFFHQSMIWETNWWYQFSHVLSEDVFILLQGQLGLSAETRTLFFLFGWAMMISAVQSLMIYRHTAGYFIAATVAYLIMLHLTLDIDFFYGIVRVIGIGLLLLSLLNKFKLEQIIMENHLSAKLMTG